MKANIKISVHQKDLNAKKQRVQLVSYFFQSITKKFKLKKFRGRKKMCDSSPQMILGARVNRRVYFAEYADWGYQSPVFDLLPSVYADKRKNIAVKVSM